MIHFGDSFYLAFSYLDRKSSRIKMSIEFKLRGSMFNFATFRDHGKIIRFRIEAKMQRRRKRVKILFFLL